VNIQSAPFIRFPTSRYRITTMRRRFFVNEFEAGSATLTGDAAHHFGRVLRAEPGQLVEVSDGRALWLARVKEVQKSAVRLELVEQLPSQPARLRIKLLLSIVKYDRFEWALEKATELGVSDIVPLAAARSEKGLIAAAANRAQRWNKVLLESAQQSRRLSPPFLHPAAKPAAAWKNAQTHGSVLVMLSERTDALGLRTILSGKSSNAAVIAVGPEGGWTDSELSSALEIGFFEASLGENILRTETAVAAALAILNYALGD
jgi:16S rRNA (uracil1498-N3)-methyltransferase